MMFRVRSACKINLTLDVIGQRANGYHELQSVVSTVGLYDELDFAFGDSGLTPGAVELTCDISALQTPDNLVIRAAQAWLHATQPRDFAGCRIALRKFIPAGAGMGGGSGNAAATLWAFNHAHHESLPMAELELLGATLGADVPLFLHSTTQGGTLLMEGIGERLTPLQVFDGWVAIVQPAMTLSTPAIYRQFDDMAPASRRDTPALLSALDTTDKRRQIQQVAAALGNDLTAPAQALGAPVAELCGLLLQAGACGASMTGSGSAVFGVFENEESARTAAKLLHLHPSVNFAAAAPLGVAGLIRA